MEVKVGARETETVVIGDHELKQVAKYSPYRAGYVAYLTMRNAPIRLSTQSTFSGIFLLEVLQLRLKRDRLTSTGQLLLDFTGGVRHEVSGALHKNRPA